MRDALLNNQEGYNDQIEDLTHRALGFYVERQMSCSPTWEIETHQVTRRWI